MRETFGDSYYFFALLNPKDRAHKPATEFAATKAAILVTTAWVLTEVGDGLAKPSHRRAVFADLFDYVMHEPNIIVLPASDELMLRGMDLFRSRPDKEWSLTDCISFVVMGERGIREALTGDRHFEQAGFVPLLK